MTIFHYSKAPSPSFPPVDDALRAIRSINTDQLLHNFKSAAALGRDCLIWTAALTVIAVQQGRKLLPHLASWLRALADFIDPDSAPLTQTMTARDIPTLEFFQDRDRMVRPTPTVPSTEELAIDADLVDLAKPELMAIYGTKSRRLSKEQLIHKIMERRATSLEEGA